MSKVNGVVEKSKPSAAAVEATVLTARFHVTRERTADIEMGDLMDIQDGSQDPRIIGRIVGLFAVDEAGEYLPAEAARAVVRKMTVRQMLAAFESIMGEVNEVAVPNE